MNSTRLNKFYRVVLSTTCAMTSLTWAASPSRGQAPETRVPKELEGYHERLVEIMEKLHVPGVAVAVVRGDETIYVDTAGERDPDKHLPVTPDTTFYIASITKTFVATAIVALIDEGKIDIDAPVTRYLPRFKLARRRAANSITIRDLLTHAKGINSDAAVWLDAYTGEITDDRFYHWLRQEMPLGSHEYTNVHFTLLGRVIEAVTGKSWKDYLDERIFKPAGMTRTTCYASKMYGRADAGIPAKRMEGGYTASHVRKNDSVMHAAGGIGASVTDLARWLRVNLNEGKIEGTTVLPAKQLEEMHKMQIKNRKGMVPNWIREGHGLGWSISKYRDYVYLEHGGGYIGTAANIGFLPDKNIGVAVVANANGIIAPMVTMEILDRLLGLEPNDLLPRFQRNVEQRLARDRKKESEPKVNPAEAGGLSQPPNAYVGDYDHKDWGTIKIRHTGGKLVGTQGVLTLEFESTGTDAFTMHYVGLGEPDQGIFEIADGRGPSAVVMTLYEKQVRFAKQ